jgi:hypothetical protein
MIDPSYLDRIGVWQADDGSYMRYRIRTKNPEYDPSDPKAEAKGMLISYEQEEVPFPVILPLATDPDSIEEARQKAVRTGADFYHPKWGWLRWGVKPEVDHRENLGATSATYSRRRVVVGQQMPTESPPETEPGVPETEPEAEPETEPAPAGAGARKGRD